MAAIDIGSNTVRLLAAAACGDGLQPILDRSEFVRLGLGVDSSGRLDPARERAAVAAVQKLADEAHDVGAGCVLAFATSAVRDAANSEEFVRRIQDETGIGVDILSGQREAYLTYLGATMAITIESCAVVCDLGGGSAELIFVDGDRVLWEVSTPLGSGRLTERFVHHDPPIAKERAELERQVRDVLDNEPPGQADLAVFTGGTASHIARMGGRSGLVVTMDSTTLEHAVHVLTSEPAAAIVSRYDFREERAKVLPAGALALWTIARYYGARQIVITRSGIREGAILDFLRREDNRPEVVTEST